MSNPNPGKPVGAKRKSRFIGELKIATKAPSHKINQNYYSGQKKHKVIIWQ
jgi:hypothetical protein